MHKYLSPRHLYVVLQYFGDHIARWVAFLRASLWLSLGFVSAAWFFPRHAHQMLELPEGTQLDRKQLRRLKHYFYGTTYLSFLFSMLRGSTRTRMEKYRFVNLSALAYHFDDLADAWQQNLLTQKSWKGSIKDYGKQHDQSGLALHLLQNVEKSLDQESFARFQGFMERVFRVETQGRQLRHAPLGMAELNDITHEKGGCSVLMFRMMLSNPLSAEEEQVWYRFGALIQLCDDIFDIWFDRQDQITTLANLPHGETFDVVRLRQIFEQLVATTYTTLMACSAPRSQRLQAWYGIHYIIALTRLCLNHYTHLQSLHGRLPLDQRQLLVLDMEKWRNRWLAIRYCLDIRTPR